MNQIRIIILSRVDDSVVDVVVLAGFISEDVARQCKPQCKPQCKGSPGIIPMIPCIIDIPRCILLNSQLFTQVDAAASLLYCVAYSLATACARAVANREKAIKNSTMWQVVCALGALSEIQSLKVETQKL